MGVKIEVNGDPEKLLKDAIRVLLRLDYDPQEIVDITQDSIEEMIGGYTASVLDRAIS